MDSIASKREQNSSGSRPTALAQPGIESANDNAGPEARCPDFIPEWMTAESDALALV
jgi:hypothetical protein